MVFQPGQSGNPLGRGKHIDPRSPELAAFCKEHRDDIKRVGEIVMERAIRDNEPWALKLCMECAPQTNKQEVYYENIN
jgi:hypothetical protein